MSTLVERLYSIVWELRAIDARFALVGGLAVSTRAQPRFTRDADLAVAVSDDAEAEALVARLRQRGYFVEAAVEQQATGRLATVRLVGRGDPTRVITDLLFASSGIEAEVVALADDIEIIPGLTLPVARTGHLIAMKLLARDDRRRPADADDLRALAEVASKADWDLAEAACRQIVDLGYGRGRDLVSLLVDVRMSN